MTISAANPSLSHRPVVSVFVLLCAAQMIALLGNQTTGFGLGIWFYERTGSVSINAVLIAATMLPPVALAPFIGVLVDRWERRAVLLAGHIGAAICAALLFALSGTAWVSSVVVVGGLVATQAAMRSAEMTLVSSATTALVPDKDRGRANGVVQLAFAIPQLAAPMLAPVLLHLAELRGLLALELAAVVVTIALLLAFVRLPTRTATSPEASALRVSQLLFGWHFVRARPALFQLSLVIALVNFVIGCVGVLMTPLILGFTGKHELGFISAVAGVGMILGSVVMAAWGGPRRRFDGIVAGAAVQSLALALGAISRTPWVVASAGFIGFFVVPIMSGSNEAIWQRKVPAGVQGRVFSYRIFLNGIAFALAYVSAGPLVDYVVAPAMADGGSLALALGSLLGKGRERAAAVAFLLVAALPMLAALAALSSRRLRYVEEDLPDSP